MKKIFFKESQPHEPGAYVRVVYEYEDDSHPRAGTVIERGIYWNGSPRYWLRFEETTEKDARRIARNNRKNGYCGKVLPYCEVDAILTYTGRKVVPEVDECFCHHIDKQAIENAIQYITSDGLIDYLQRVEDPAATRCRINQNWAPDNLGE